MVALRKIIKKVLVAVFVWIDELIVRWHLAKPRIIIYMDGGLCSQMNMWIQGQYYAEQGIDVYYDLDWFRRDGKGIDGVSIRHYELETLWPNIRVKTMPRITTSFYRLLLPWKVMHCQLPAVKEIRRSVYFKGYNHLEEQDKIRLYHRYFNIRFANMTERMHLEEKRYCGVHVRRGDLANVTNISVYPQMADGYFIRAIDYVMQHEKIDEFLLFSEDAQWLKENILPNTTAKCRIVEGNKGYEDLMLLAQCQVIVASQGSFGPTAALINQNCELLIRNTAVSEHPYANRELFIQ